MSDGDFVTLATFQDAVSASIVRAQLEEAGIRTFLHGSETANALWHVGSALGGVQLQVQRRDVPNASEVLDRVRPGTTRFDGESTRFCGDCGEFLASTVDNCPVCGADRSRAVEREPAADITLEELTAAALADGAAEETERDHPDESAGGNEGETTVGDTIAKRAWRSALMSYVCFPLALYTPWLLLKGVYSAPSPRGWRYLGGALVLSVLPTLVTLILAALVVFGYGLGPLIDYMPLYKKAF